MKCLSGAAPFLVCLSVIFVSRCDSPSNPFDDPANVRLSMTVAEPADSLVHRVADSVRVRVVVVLSDLVDSLVLSFGDGADSALFINASQSSGRDTFEVAHAYTVAGRYRLAASATLQGGAALVCTTGVLVADRGSPGDVAILLTEPQLRADSGIVSQASTTLRGEAVGRLPLWNLAVRVNGASVAVTGTQNWSAAVALRPAQWNVVSVMAVDTLGRATTKVVYVFCRAGLDTMAGPRFSERLCVGMVLQWSAVAHCSRYLVQRSDRDAQSGFVSVASVRDTVFEDTGLDSGEPYWYRLRGFYDSTYGSFHVSDTTESWSAAVCESTVVCWQKVYGSGQGGEVAASIAEVADGYVFTGLTPASTAGASSVWLVKVDCRGSVVWDKAFGGEGFDQGFAVRSDGGGVVLAGARGSDSVSLGGSWLAHMDGNGAPTWESRGSIVFDRSPGWFSLYTLRRGGALSDEGSMFWWHRQDSIFKAVVAGVDMAGQKQWQTVIDKRQVWCGAKLLDGRVVVGGHADSASGGCWAAQLSGDGMVEWQSQYRGLAGDALFGIAPVLDGYVATGLTRASDTSACDLRLMHISRTGYAWLDTTYRSNTGECGSAVVWNQAQQALIVAGLGSSVVGGSNDVLLLKADFSGRVAWRRWFGGGSSDAGLCVGCTRDGGFLVLGTSSSFGGTRVYVVKTDSRGNCPFQP